MRSPLVLLQLNEINIDLVEAYINNGETLPNFKKLLDDGILTTESEAEYEYLEPWIQWPSIYTGKKFVEHGVFRLGDAEKMTGSQIFELVEGRGYQVGCISPINAVNALQSPAFFIPDPWTDTPPDKTFSSRILSSSIATLVNANANRKTPAIAGLKFLCALLLTLSLPALIKLIPSALRSLRRPWRRALFLDLVLVKIFISSYKNKKPDFSSLFLNAVAHIQHHYLYHSKIIEMDDDDRDARFSEDPILEAYLLYDSLLGELYESVDGSILLASGLSQTIYAEKTFYYRLSSHAQFLKKIGVCFSAVFPRMSRDFLVEFDGTEERDSAKSIISSITLNGVRLFGQIEAREKQLFVTLDYPNEITNEAITILNRENYSSDFCLDDFSFVSLKNAEHRSMGFVHFGGDLSDVEWNDGDGVEGLHNIILDWFPIKTAM